MLYLNLTKPETSEIAFEVSKFPDGQQQVKIIGKRIWKAEGKSTEETLRVVHTDGHTKVTIKVRLNNFQDLELIICAIKSLRNLGFKEIHLYTPYFLGSRSDRKFEEGSNNYLKDIICPIINSLNFESVTVIDPHSDVLEACLNNFKKLDNSKLVRFATNNYQYENQKKSGVMSEDFILISPDAGANKKIFKVAEQIGYIGEIITCSKSRDEHGKLSRTEIPLQNHHIKGDAKDFIIIDDICDGGATFINIVKELKKGTKDFEWDKRSKIYLIVTHGIFSKGFKELNQYFDGVYCTNSYSDLNSPEMTLKHDNELHKVKQLNVF